MKLYILNNQLNFMKSRRGFMKPLLFILSFVLLMNTSCSEDFLEKEPFDSITANSFFSNEAEIEQGVNATYAELRGRTFSDWVMGEFRSDNTHFIYNPTDRGRLTRENVANFLTDATSDETRSKYTANFNMIDRANRVLVAIDGIEDIDPSKASNLKGQVLFLRGLAYFDLVKYFGGVPLYLEPVSSYDNAFVSRSSADEIFNQAISDAQQAIDLLLPVGVQGEGRATKGAAQTLLGDIFLYQGKYAQAEVEFKKVTGYALLGDYADVFSTKNSAESIFEVQYIQSLLSNNYFYVFLPPIGDTSVVTGVDGRFNGGNGFNNATPDLVNSYEVGDLRYAASIGWVAASEITGVNYQATMMPYSLKHLIPHSIFNDVGVNIPIYRYAEVLLSLAEVLNEQGKTGEALGPLNQVRIRAGLTATAETDQSALRILIANERKVELAFENKRWNDLVRTGQAISVMNAYGNNIKANPGDYWYSDGDAPIGASYNVTSEDLLFPIPQSERDINPELTQNPGY